MHSFGPDENDLEIFPVSKLQVWNFRIKLTMAIVTYSHHLRCPSGRCYIVQIFVNILYYFFVCCCWKVNISDRQLFFFTSLTSTSKTELYVSLLFLFLAYCLLLFFFFFFFISTSMSIFILQPNMNFKWYKFYHVILTWY